MIRRMSRLLLIFAFIITAPIMMVELGAAAEDGLVAEWHFDENPDNILIDSSGNGNDGAIYGATWTTDGIIGTGLQFDGNDYVTVPDSPELSGGIGKDMTVEFWFNSNKQGGSIITKWRDSSKKDWGTSLGQVFWYEKSGNDRRFYGGTIQEGVWHHGAFSFKAENPSGANNAELTYYLDGEEIDITFWNDHSPYNLLPNQLYDMPDTSAPVSIGYSGRVYNSGYFNGKIDEIKIYNRTLSSEEIKNKYDKLKNPLPYIPSDTNSPLAGKIIIIDPGHGLYKKSDGSYNFQRPYLEVVEENGVEKIYPRGMGESPDSSTKDLNNALVEDKVVVKIGTYLKNYLEQNGAIVYSTRDLTIDNSIVGKSGYPRWEEGANIYLNSEVLDENFANWLNNNYNNYNYIYSPITSKDDVKVDQGPHGPPNDVNVRWLYSNYLKDTNPSKEIYYVSIHTNGAGGHGTLTLYRKNKDFAKSLQEAVVEKIQNDFDPTWVSNAEAIRYSTVIGVLNKNENPAALVEVAFHDNISDNKYLLNDNFLTAAAEGILEGLNGKNGLYASYYSKAIYRENINAIEIPYIERIDPKIDFDWQTDPLPINKDGWWSVDWTGFVYAPEEGTYQFKLNSDDGSWLYIDGKEVIDNGGDHSPYAEPGEIYLTEGYHSMHVKYFNSYGGQAIIELFWQPPGKTDYNIIPPDFLFISPPNGIAPILKLSKNAPPSMDQGYTMTYTLYYHNFGSSSASNVELKDTLPEDVDFVSASDDGGTRIAFQSMRDKNEEIYVMNADGRQQTRLTENNANDAYPTWSPDGKKIAFVSDRDGNWEIYVMNADGSGDQIDITNNPSDDGYPAWSTGGQKIVFASDRDPQTTNRDIYSMDINGNNILQLTTDPAEDVHPAWSPDGRKIAFASDRDGNRKIFIKNLGNSYLFDLTNNGDYNDYPAWSPNGKKIAFASSRDSKDSKKLDIYLMNVDDLSVIRLTKDPNDDRHPTWSKDGKNIIFVSDRNGDREIFVINENGEDINRLTNQLGNDQHPAIDPKTVTWNIDLIPAKGGRGSKTVTVKIPSNIPINTVIQNTAILSYDNEQIIADAQTKVTQPSLPPDVNVEPIRSTTGGTPSVYWRTPLSFSYTSCDTATGVDINIHINDGKSDITGSMSGGPNDWSYFTKFHPRHGLATLTYTVHGCNQEPVNFNIYIDPAGYIFDVDTGERIADASVWLQRPNGVGSWENVPIGQTPPVSQPDENPLITGVNGQYKWDVLEGAYRVHVEADGYYPTDSIMVIIPPPVTDLHVGLTRIPSANKPPVANASGPYTGSEGQPIIFNGSSSYDPDAEDSIVSYEWDFDTDGITDATGMETSWIWNNDYTGVVSLTVTDSHGENDTDITSVTVLNVPPSSITNINSISCTTWINWIWSNPSDSDFNYTEIYLNGIFKTNIPAPQNYYNSTGLLPDTSYELSTRTVDISGNVNQSWMNDTATTLSADTEPPAFDSVNHYPAVAYAGAVVNVSAAVSDDSGVADVMIDGVALSDQGEGKWTGSFVVPADAAVGDHVMSLTANDAAGNGAEIILSCNVVNPVGGIAITSTPKPLMMTSGTSGVMNVKLVSSANFDDIVEVTLDTSGFPDAYAADLSWFNRTSVIVQVPAGQTVIVPFDVSIPDDVSGYKVFKDSARSLGLDATSMDTGVVYVT